MRTCERAVVHDSRRYRAPVVEPGDLRAQMPLLEAPRSTSGLDDDAAARLILFTLDGNWQDHWVSCVLDWIDSGLWRDEFAEGLPAIVDDKTRYSQATRHRAWAQVKPRR